MHNQFPILVKDSFWEEEEPTLPYTKSSLNLRTKAHLGSAANLYIGNQDAEFVPLEPIMEDEKDDYVLNELNENLTPDMNGYRFNYDMNKPDLDCVSISTAGIRIPDNVPGSKFFKMLFGQSCENVNKNMNDRYIYYNAKKNPLFQDEQNVQTPNQTSAFLQMPIRFQGFANRKKKVNVTRSNTTSTSNSIIKFVARKNRKRSVGNVSVGMKNAESSTAVSHISNDDLNSLQSEAVSFTNYKSSPIANRKNSLRIHGHVNPSTDQQSLINFDKLPELGQLNDLNSMPSSADSSENQPVFTNYFKDSANQNLTNPRFYVYNFHQALPQPHQLVRQLNQKLAHLERKNQHKQSNALNFNHYQTTYNQAYDELSTVSSISGLQISTLPHSLNVERSDLLNGEIRVMIEDDKKSPIFNINNTNTFYTKSTEIETINKNIILPSNLLNIKTNKNDLEKICKENNSNSNSEDKELVTIAEEKIESINQNDTNLIPMINTITNENKKGIEKPNRETSLDDIYEPNYTNSSQESLSPFQSNQNTVTSFADLIKKTEDKNIKDEN